jgi:hypothetical protein
MWSAFAVTVALAMLVFAAACVVILVAIIRDGDGELE